ncbi:MAG: phosphatidate cytidylyltransferase, partial [Muribaculaceae bacterium]|nr:phosphatidate cytidylyltransferase [Muribaculaceae bacterium]
MHKFLVRAASGIVYAAVIILAIIYGQWSIYALSLFFAATGFCELNHMALGYSRRLLPVYITSMLGVMLVISVVKAGFMSCPYPWILALTALFLLLVIAYYLSVKKIIGVTPSEFYDGDYHKAPQFGFGYLGFPLSFMAICPLPRLALLVFALLWINDSGAYIVGSLTGRHKLCPSISPNKTWEGFIGGCLLTVIGALLLDLYCDSFFGMAEFPLWIWIVIGILTCIFGTLGDLLESKIKRFY